MISPRGAEKFVCSGRVITFRAPILAHYNLWLWPPGSVKVFRYSAFFRSFFILLTPVKQNRLTSILVLLHPFICLLALVRRVDVG